VDDAPGAREEAAPPLKINLYFPMPQKYRIVEQHSKPYDATIPEMLDGACRQAGNYTGGQLESLQAEHGKLRDIVGNLMEKLIDSDVLTPREAADCITYGVEEIEPIN
jgi:hypothetical protein